PFKMTDRNANKTSGLLSALFITAPLARCMAGRMHCAQCLFAMMFDFLFNVRGRALIRQFAIDNQLVEPGNEENREKCRGAHASHLPGSRGMARAGACAG